MTWVHIEIGDDFDEYYMGHHAKQLQFYVILFYVFGLSFFNNIILFVFMLMLTFRV